MSARLSAIIALAITLLLGFPGLTLAGVNLEVPLEMVDLGLASEKQRGRRAGTTTDFNRSWIYLNPNHYDGSTYYFEIVAKNADSVERTVALKCTSNNTTYAEIVVDAGTAEYTRKRVSWSPANPASGKNAYLVSLERTKSEGDLVVQTARIIVQQTDATRTRIQIPLAQRSFNDSGGPGDIVDATTSTTYSQGDDRNYSLWQKETSRYDELRGSTPWTFEAVLANSKFFGKTSAALYSASGAMVGGSEISNTGVISRMKDVSFSDSIANFTNGEAFEVRIKNEGNGEARLASGARLYVSLTNLNKAEVLYRIGRSSNGTDSIHMVGQRVLLDTDSFSDPRVAFEASGICADYAEKVFLHDSANNDQGISGSSVNGSGIRFNSGIKSRVRTSPISLTSGHRFFASTSASNDSLILNHAWLVVAAGINVPILGWTDNPGFIGDGVHSDTGQSGATFEFQVKYTDAEDNAPIVSQVWIDSDDNGQYEEDEKFDMTKLSEQDEDYTLGVNYSYIIPIEDPGDGVLNYRFYFNDGEDDATGPPTANHPLTIVNVPPTLNWTGNSGFESDGVDPDIAGSGSSFEFQVTYTDIDNDAPTTSQVWIDLNDNGSYQAGEKFDMMNSGGSNYTQGVNYSASMNIAYSGDGTLNWQFYFSDGKDDASGDPTTDGALVLTNEIPALNWTGENGFESNGVNPDSDIPGSSFEFQVTYTDLDDDSPTVQQVWIDLDDSGDYNTGEKFDMNSEGGVNYSAGVNFSYSKRIGYAGDGTLTYRFYFSDGKQEATGEPATSHTLPLEETTIQALINLASSNLGAGETTTVIVGPGTYNETITMKDGVNVVSAQGTKPVITGSGVGNAAVVFSEMTCNLKGFDISGSEVFVDGSGGRVTAMIEACDIHDNKDGHGIELSGLVSVVITECNIYENGQGGMSTGEEGLASNSSVAVSGSTISRNAAAGISLRSVAQFSLENNSIFSNTQAGLLLVDVDTVSPHIRNNELYDHNKGAGVNIGGTSILTIENNDIYRNYAGIVFYVSTNPDVTGEASSQPITIRDNDIHRNSYGGISVRDPVTGTVTITENNIHNNKKGGVGIENACNLEITGNQIHDNVRGGIHTGRDEGQNHRFLGSPGSAKLHIKRNVVHHNGGSNYGGGIDVRYASGIIHNNLVYENKRGGIRFGDFVTEILNNTVVKNGQGSRGGGIVYDDLAGAVNDDPSGDPPSPLTIKNNISTHNKKAGIRACFTNTEGSEERDYNLVYANHEWNELQGRHNEPDCGWPDSLIMSCTNQQYGGCGAHWEYYPTRRAVIDSPHDIMADPIFVDADGGRYQLQDGSPAKWAGDDGNDMGAYGGDSPIDW